MPLARLLWLLLLLGVSVPAIPAALVADDAALLSPYPWSWRKIISAVERRAALGLLEPRSAEAAADSYQLIDNLPTVEKKSSNTTRLLLQPERCDNCTPGTKPQPAGAGRVNSLVHKFTDSKSRALPGQFPWHVSLLYREWFYSCSGSLVSDEWIITAANCVHGFDSIKVRLGSFRPGLKDERFRTTMTCSHIVVHPGYRKGSPKDDIAVLRLSGLVRMNGYILPVRLPSLNSFSTSYTGRKAWLSGWGVTSSLGKLSSSASLGYVQEEVLPNERCADTFGEISSSVLCTSTSRFTSDNQVSEPCIGDSGAPLVVDEGGFFVQIGVLSFAPSAGFARGGAAGFTRVTSYLRWIQNVTAIAPGSDINVVE